MKLAPLRLAPIFVPRIWGSRDLRPLFTEPKENAGAPPHGSDAIAPQSGEPIGEVWLTGESCEVACGSQAGRSLGEIWQSQPQEFTGSRAFGTPRIPLLVKFIFPEDKLSVQVHPNDDYAREHEAAAGGTGKTEMWYAVAAHDGAEVRLGLEPGVTRESFRQSVADGAVEQSLRQFKVRAGDAFFVPAGTAHMIGPGMVLCEVQEHSDLTYRVFDYNRLQADGKPRQLHLRQSLEVMNFGAQIGGLSETLSVRRGPLWVKYLAACSHFVVERWEFSERIEAATSPESFEVLVMLAGTGRIECATESVSYGPAEAWLLPASLGAYQIVPEIATTLLRSYVPDIGEFAASLATQGIEEAEIARLVHR